MAFTTITPADIADKGVIGMPDKPDLTTTQMQKKLDELATDVIIPKHNGLIAELEAGTAGASIGVMDGATATNLQARLDDIAAGGYTKAEADETFLKIETAEETYLSQEDAASTYLSLEDASDDYLTKSDASDTYLSKTDAASTYYTQASATTDLAGKADVSSVPTKVSDLTNDSGYITSSSLPTKVSDLTNDAGYVTSSAIPTKVSDLTNDSGYITSSSLPTKVSDLTNDSGFIANGVKTVKVGSTNIVASGEDTIEFVAGSNVTLTPDSTNKKVTIEATGGGSSSGDMLASDYDSDYDVKTAGGIKSYVSSAISGKADTSSLATVATSGAYSDLSGTPTIPDAQIQSDWDQSDNTAKDYIKNKPTIPTVTGKADKVTGATNGNFAGLDSNGNLTDSGKKHGDYLTDLTAGNASSAGQVKYTYTKNGTSYSSSASVNGWTPVAGVWTSTVSKVTGDTSVAFTNSAISSTSILELYSSNTSGTPIAYESVSISGTTATFTIPALTESTDFKLWIRNLS